MARKAPQVGDLVKSRVSTDGVAGYIVGKEGIYVWVRFFDTKFEAGESWDVYTRRDTLEILSRADSH